MNKEYEDAYRRIHTIGEEISRGGQGVVYRTNDPDIALKLELNGLSGEVIEDPSANDKYKRLRLLAVPRGLHITMPLAVLTNAGGYVMTLLSDMISFARAFEAVPENAPRNSWIDDVFAKAPEELKEYYYTYWATGGSRRRLDAYMKAAMISAKLHTNGLVYCDYSKNNIFVSSDLKNANVWFIDADNLNYRSELKNGAYTPMYCAPEVLDKKFGFYSDCYAFAVMLFEQLTSTHPFKGELYENEDSWNEETADDKITNGTYPWILDSEDRENSANPVIEYTNIMDEYMIELFNRTFSDTGRKRPLTRPSMLEWVYCIAENFDHTIRCPKCGMDFTENKNTRCVWCDNDVDCFRIISYCEAPDGEMKKIWEYIHEKQGEILNIPLRAINGEAMNTDEDFAFSMEFKNDIPRLSNFNSGIVFSRETDANTKEMIGSVDMQGSRCEFKAYDRKSRMEYTVKVEL